jgi:phosphate:Na+ symporter
MYTKVFILLFVGLAVFIFAMRELSDALSIFAGSKLNRFLKHASANRLRGVIAGTFVTTLLDSSSAVIIILLALVKSGWIDALSSYAIVLGANIGTTISSQIIALKFADYLILALPLGIILQLISSKDHAQKTSKIFVYLGLLFLGLYLIDEAVEPLKSDQSLKEVFLGLNHHYYAALIGMLVTLVIQSSSATVALAITLSGTGLLTAEAGIGIMLGAELGTCADTLIACLGKNKDALKVGSFHFFFNVITILFALIFFKYFFHLNTWIWETSNSSKVIANAHFLFNTLGVLLALPFLKVADKLLNRWVNFIFIMIKKPQIQAAQA